MDDLYERATKVLNAFQVDPDAFMNQFNLSHEEILLLNKPYVLNCLVRMARGENPLDCIATIACSSFSTGWMVAYDLAKERYDR